MPIGGRKIRLALLTHYLRNFTATLVSRSGKLSWSQPLIRVWEIVNTSPVLPSPIKSLWFFPPYNAPLRPNKEKKMKIYHRKVRIEWIRENSYNRQANCQTGTLLGVKNTRKRCVVISSRWCYHPLDPNGDFLLSLCSNLRSSRSPANRPTRPIISTRRFYFLWFDCDWENWGRKSSRNYFLLEKFQLKFPAKISKKFYIHHIMQFQEL